MEALEAQEAALDHALDVQAELEKANVEARLKRGRRCAAGWLRCRR